jgi:DNA polymerase-3 subunit gamma/tau
LETVNIHDSLRPRSLAEMSGNVRAVADLTKMFEQGKLISSTFLVSGPKGTGKTTTGFLIARYLNCATHDACGKCPSCKAMNADPKKHPDIMFVDIGSNGKIEDIRNLQQRVSRQPRYNKFVIILDEAHAFGSQAAATAMLTTLESPPPNTVFVLCTTNPEKLLPTIISRATHYKLTTLTKDEVVKGLQRAVSELGLRPQSKTDKENAKLCLAKIAEASGGHMRDALSILQRFIPNVEEGWDASTIDAILEATADVKTIAELLASILKMDLPDVVYSLRTHKEMRPLLHGLRWLLFYVIGDAAESNKFQTADLKVFLALKAKEKLKYNLPMLIKLQSTLIKIEQAMNQGVHEQVAMETFICELMVNEYEAR